MPEDIKPHELDILQVVNIDVDCDCIDPDEGYSHRDYFQVRWDGQPHRIPPGQTKRLPRFLAEHYAKHLADHFLMQMEERTGRKGLMQSPVERPRVLSQILPKVEDYHLGDTRDDRQKVVDMVDQLNPDERAVDLGTVPNPMVGVLKPEPPSLDQIMKQSGEEKAESTQKTSVWDSSKPKPTRAELLADCEKLGIEVNGKETVDTLIAKVKAF